MALQTKTRLGAYEILLLIGSGGMGEVYRAKDTKLGREVALKILPATFTNDPERLARFRREAQVLAALNHPHIAQIYGVDEANGTQFLVLELVDGESLDKRIARGKIPVDEALAIATQIAEALEAAHEKGIIHRDLKPANIALTKEGNVKVLDFGLAKATEAASGASIDVTNSPTITSPVMMTGMGVILGTAAYMSPEQAKGRPADKRSDAWAFGCVLYEMLTAAPAFAGEDVSDTLANILKREPDWSILPDEAPVGVRRVLHRCLNKDPRRRLQHFGDARLDFDEKDVQQPSGRRRRVAWPVTLAVTVGSALVGAIAGAFLMSGRSQQPGLAVARFAFRAPTGLALSTAPGIQLALSPDGRVLVFGSAPTGLFKRPVDSLVVEPVRGAENGSDPFFSPDGAWIGFRSGRSLRKVPTGGGSPITISADVGDNDTATWSDDDVIVFRRGSDLYQVSANGGAPALALKGDAGNDFTQPRFIPHTRVLLVQRQGARASGSVGSGRVEAVELDTGARHDLVDGNTPQWSLPGHLLFERDGTLWAVPLDLKRFRIVGTAVPVVQSVRRVLIRALYSAANGALAYIAGDSETNRSLVWIDRSGHPTPALPVRDALQSPRLSPDARSVAVSVANASALDVWVYDLDRGTRLRLTTSGVNRRSVWSPDGSQIAFYAAPTGAPGADQDLFVVPAGGGEAKRLLARPERQYPDTWSPDGKFLVFEESANAAGRGRDLWLLPVGQAPRPLVVTPFNERGAVFAPGGRWFAFVSDESGASEVYVQAFPGPGAKIPVSASGGLQPMWSRDGRELYYRERDWLMAVAIQLEPFHIGVPRRLFELAAKDYNLDLNFSDYDVAPDGRFLAIRNENVQQDQVHVVLNWQEELKQRVPTR